MAFYELIIKESKEPLDNQKIFQAVHSLKSKLKITATTTTKDRISNINLTKGLIQNYFKSSQNSARSSGSYVMDLENCLRRSKIEAPHYDFKQGVYNLNNKNRCFDEQCFDKICQNISAIANLGKGKKGFILLGVTDNEQDTQRVENLDKINAPRFGSFGIVGLEREANIKNISLDDYILFISRKIRDSQLAEWLKTQVNTSLTPINYSNYTVLMIKVQAGNEPAWYKNKLYIRDGHEKQAQEKSGEQISAVYNLFR
ncbi:MAG: putative DNA binding domain-containing protein [Xenococcaceae cyanobacterium MO_167.B27]|nr:putative DNA binding domain-containing protein [Xenococcaceae cyanobacterium MO_167.B27]